MSDFEYVRATDLDSAWPNFELDLPLEPQSDGTPNPFYVKPPGNPAELLVTDLRHPYRQPPKYFFSGHRGCGKSTELRRLAVRPAILAKYWPVHFTIRDEADIHDLDFKDVLLAIGSRLFLNYRDEGGKLPDQLLSELNTWRGEVVTEVSTLLGGRISESEIGFEAEIRGEYRRFLTKEQRKILRIVRERNYYDEPEKIAPPLQTLAALEYADDEPWWDAHPALYKLLDEAE
jgi:hypothetical protein